jgi:hypothetical protein
MERWSYKPEAEGLSPSLGTKIGHGDTETRRDGVCDNQQLEIPVSPRLPSPRWFSGRDSSRQNADCQTVELKRRGSLTPRPKRQGAKRKRVKRTEQSAQSKAKKSKGGNYDLDAFVALHFALRPFRVCSSAELERLSSKQKVAGSNPARLAKSKAKECKKGRGSLYLVLSSLCLRFVGVEFHDSSSEQTCKEQRSKNKASLSRCSSTVAALDR